MKSVRTIRVEGDTAYVALTKGFVAVIDASDVGIVAGYNWTALVKANVVYAKRAIKVDGHYVTVRMHRELLDAPDGILVDHRDGNGLNNRRKNLRLSTNSQNLCNRGSQRNGTSGFKGVTRHKLAGKWMAQIKQNGRRHYLGLFDKPEDAAAAYKTAAEALHGEFARSEPQEQAA
jgi:hypothetical protein